MTLGTAERPVKKLVSRPYGTFVILIRTNPGINSWAIFISCLQHEICTL